MEAVQGEGGKWMEVLPWVVSTSIDAVADAVAVAVIRCEGTVR